MTKLKFRGFIFDVDDTLLDNKPGIPGSGLHERSRLKACQILGEELNIPELKNVTFQENYDAFITSPIHSMPGAVWNLLLMKGLVAGDSIDFENELLQKIVNLKNEVHAQVLMDEGEEVPGASDFVSLLVENGARDKLAIASSAIRRDIDLFLTKMGLDQFFPDERIMSYESMKHTKPHPEVFNLAFESLRLPDKLRKNVLAFEDDPRGIMSAVAAGLTVCAITTRFSKEKLQSLEIAPDFIIGNYTEAYELVGL